MHVGEHDNGTARPDKAWFRPRTSNQVHKTLRSLYEAAPTSQEREEEFARSPWTHDMLLDMKLLMQVLVMGSQPTILGSGPKFSSLHLSFPRLEKSLQY